MVKKYLVVFGLAFSLGNYSSQKPILHYFSQEELDKLEFDKAAKHKRRYALPTPASFGELQTETPAPASPIFFKSLQDWLKDYQNIENQLHRLKDYECYVRFYLEQELEQADKNWHIRMKNKELHDKALIRSKNEKEPPLVEHASPFNVKNRQIIINGPSELSKL